MMDQEPSRPRFTSPLDASRNDEYRVLSGLAVAGLVLGVLSAVALIEPRAAFVAVAGVLASILALWRIARRSPELVGRKAAIAGLLLSLLLGSVALGHVLTYRWLLIHQTRQVGMAWFDLLAQGQPQAAHQLLVKPNDRQTPGNDLWKFYRADENRYKSLEHFVNEPLPRTLLALGDRATVRPYATESVEITRGGTVVYELFSVTFDRDGQKTTFLVRLGARLYPDAPAGGAPWQIVVADGGVKPEWEERDDWLTSS